MKTNVFFLADIHGSMNNLVYHMIPGQFVCQVRSNGRLSKLLQQDINESVKHSWCVKELLELFIRFIRCLNINVINQTQRDILEDSDIVLLVLQYLLFGLPIGHLGHVHVVNISLMWQSKPGKVVSDPEPLLTGLDAIGLTLDVLLFAVAAIHLIWHYTVSGGLREDSIPPNVLIGVILEPVTMDRLNNLIILVLWDNQLWFFWLWLTQVLLLWNLCQVVFTLVVGNFSLLSLQIAGKGGLELLEQLELNLLFDLRDDLPAENEEIISGILADTRLVTHSQMWVNVGSDWTSNRVPYVSGCQVSHRLARQQRVDELIWLYL
jgi:hypothetical protein